MSQIDIVMILKSVNCKFHNEMINFELIPNLKDVKTNLTPFFLLIGEFLVYATALI